MWKGLAISLTLAIATSLLSIVDPLLMRRLIDTELPQLHFARTLLLVSGIAACLLGRVIFFAVSTDLNFSAEQTLSQRLRIAMLDQLSRLSPDYHEAVPPGETASRLDGDVEQVSQLGSEFAVSAVRTAVFLVANALLMLGLNLSLALAIAPLLSAFLWLHSRVGARLERHADRVQDESGHVSSKLYEHVSSLIQLQLLGAEKQLSDKLGQAWATLLKERKNQKRTEVSYVAANGFLVVLATLLILVMGSARVVHGALTIGTLIAFYTAATRMFEPISSMMELHSRLKRAGASVRRVRSLLESEATVRDTGTIRKIDPGLRQGIQLTKVSFVYSGRKAGLENLSLVIKPGEAIGIIGPSGSGKSTLARLLVRMADPQIGSITLDGHLLPSYSLAALRKVICYVPQNPILFNTSLHKNLLYGNPDATDYEVESVIQIAELKPVVDRLPSGLDSEVGPLGHNLSGGERQRVALARALLRKAPVLILDESTSALDAATESAVLQQIVRRRAPLIFVVISHRLVSLRWLDRLVVLQDGRIAAVGTHDNLDRESMLYRKLRDGHLVPFGCGVTR